MIIVEFGDRRDRSASQALLKWSSDLKKKDVSFLRGPAYGNDVELQLVAEVKARIEAGLPVDDVALRLLLVGLLREY